MNKLKQIASLLTCFIIMLAVSISFRGEIFGVALNKSEVDTEVVSVNSDCTIVVSTGEIAKDVKGYGGRVPLKLYLKDRKIVKIEIEKNAETPEFVEQVEKYLLPNYINKSIDELQNQKVDVVSGATLTSNAVIKSIEIGLAQIDNVEVSKVDYDEIFTFKFFVTILVILSAGILPLFLKSKKFRIVQLVLNVAVLGFWSGSFISYSMLVNYLANGVNIIYSIIQLMLIVIAFVYPLIGKKSHYCTWVCPFGAMQELAGKGVKYKVKISPKVINYLNIARQVLWGVLMLFMWSGVMFKWMDYEPFSAFIFNNASYVAIALAVLFVIISTFVNRPYCRFVCPTGTLLKISQNTEK